MAVINGKENISATGLSFAEYLARENYRPERIVIERNGEILSKQHYESEVIRPDDKIEIVSFVGGGSLKLHLPALAKQAVCQEEAVVSDA